MNTIIANALGGYFETLYDVNIKLIKLCGIETFASYENNEWLVFDIIQDIFRLVPCVFDKKHSKLILDTKSGLLEFESDFKFIKDDFQFILDNYNPLLNSLRQVRNKYEHKMHSAKIVAQGSSSDGFFDFEFDVEKNKFTLYAHSLIDLITKLNCTYSKIQKEVYYFANNNNKLHYLYYQRLIRVNFNDFTKIYQDDNLQLIGRLMHKF